MKNLSPIEILENRIAPAVFFVANNAVLGAYELQDSTGAAVTGNIQAASETGALFALHLGKGDSLVFDVNHNHIVDKGVDVLLFKVNSGQAIAFLSDFEGDGIFQVTDFSGLAVGNSDGKAFSGGGNVGLNGSVATMLDSSGNLTLGTLQHTSIAGLKLGGSIGGDFGGYNIVAGGSISKVAVKGSIFGVIATGTGAANHATVAFANGSDVSFGFEAAPGENGGDISGVKLLGGVTGIYAGSAIDSEDDGDPGTAPIAPGHGGSIVNVGLGNILHLEAGSGGASGELPGGAGGSISKVKGVSFTFGESLTIIAGNGGSGTSGAPGGSIDGLSIGKFGDGGMSVTAGTGGDGFAGVGGAGGSITKSTLKTSQDGQETIIAAGNGGMGALDMPLSANNVAADATGFAGGKGGSITGLKYSAAGTGLATPSLIIAAGSGGGGAIGGDGGAIIGGGLKLAANVGVLRIAGGIGADGGSTGGAGGGVSSMKIKMVGSTGGVDLTGGHGGSASDEFGTGGVGGSVDLIALENVGFIGGDGVVLTSGSVEFPLTLAIHGGDGGLAYGNSDGEGGNGGNATNVKLKNTGGIGSAAIFGGSASPGPLDSGNGGSVAHIAVTGSGALANPFSSDIPGLAILGGNGGIDVGYGSALSHGGAGGGVMDVVVKYTGAPTIMVIGAGGGSEATGPDGIGGAGGSVSAVTISAPRSFVTISAGRGGAADGQPFILASPDVAAFIAGGTAAGNGGSVSSTTVKADQLNVFAGSGGESSYGQGGAGGNIGSLNLTGSARFIVAGDGGGTSQGFAGNGGSIDGVTVTGDIGAYSGFTIIDLPAKFTGLIAGQSGAIDGVHSNAGNGSISNVTASRISAIYAGFTSVLNAGDFSVANAVTQIIGLQTTVLGLDTNGDHAFTYAEGNPDDDSVFQLPGDVAADGDSTEEGLVIVKTGGFVVPAGLTPLHVVEV